MSYYKILGFTKEPFSTSPDPDFFYFSREHETALTNILIEVRLKRGLSVILGDVGTGKTTLSRKLIQELKGRNDFTFHMILDPTYPSETLFFHELTRTLGIELSSGLSSQTVAPGCHTINQLQPRIQELEQAVVGETGDHPISLAVCPLAELQEVQNALAVVRKRCEVSIDRIAYRVLVQRAVSERLPRTRMGVVRLHLELTQFVPILDVFGRTDPVRSLCGEQPENPHERVGLTGLSGFLQFPVEPWLDDCVTSNAGHGFAQTDENLFEGHDTPPFRR